MRVLLINPPYITITSRVGVGHQVPLGLLMVGGALVDAGHDVTLLDAEARRLTIAQVIEQVRHHEPDVIMAGHAGSTPAHPVCCEMFKAIRAARPCIINVYGGVFPTYHSESVLRDTNMIDVIVRGEGEATSVDLINTLARIGSSRAALNDVAGITFRDGDGVICRTADRPPIRDLDAYRIGWELLDDWDRYQCFGMGRAGIIQFSRGCPHRCNYCGQHGFWNKWRHRDPVGLADEIEWLHREHGVRFITLADENPTTSPRIWRAFLEEVAARDVDVHFFATMRADDIVRDEAFLDLYRKAGILYVLLGIDTTNPQTIESVRKRSAVPTDQRACELLRQHGMRSIIAQIVGLGTESKKSMQQTHKALRHYSGDLLNVMYATPHTWTDFARAHASAGVVQDDQRCWDYRHQVLASPTLGPRRLFAMVKWMEACFHARPRRLTRLIFERDPLLRQQLRWTAVHIGSVWLAEMIEMFTRVRFARRPRLLREWLKRADQQASPSGSRLIEVSVVRPNKQECESVSDRCATRFNHRPKQYSTETHLIAETAGRC